MAEVRTKPYITAFSTYADIQTLNMKNQVHIFLVLPATRIVLANQDIKHTNMENRVIILYESYT